MLTNGCSFARLNALSGAAETWVRALRSRHTQGRGPVWRCIRNMGPEHQPRYDGKQDVGQDLPSGHGRLPRARHVFKESPDDSISATVGLRGPGPVQ